MTAGGGGRESEAGKEALAPRVCKLWLNRHGAWSGGAAPGATGTTIFSKGIACNLLKSPDSDEGIQMNPRESKSDVLVFLGLAWSGLVRLGMAWFGLE